MKELKGLIERAEVAAGSQKELGLILGINPSNIRNAKAGQCGIPSYACVIIAEMIGEKDITVIAASELATEKKADRRKVWEKKLEALAATVMIAVVTTVATPSPAEARSYGVLAPERCILCQIEDA